MKHKITIIASAAIALILSVLLAFLWLCQTRYFITSVENGEGAENDAIYARAVETLERKYSGKFFFSIDADEVAAELSRDPYVASAKVEKVFPDRLVVTFKERKERFVFCSLNGESVYVTDSDFVLLRIASADEVDSNLTRVNAINYEIDGASLVLGSPAASDPGNIVGAMAKAFDRFSDKLNLIDGITVYGSDTTDTKYMRNVVEYQTITGVAIRLYFASASSSGLSTDKICDKIGEVEAKYNSLSERQKTTGYISAIETDDGSVSVEYESEETEE